MFASVVDALEVHLPANLKGSGPQILFAISALFIVSMDFVQLCLVGMGAVMYLVMHMPVRQRTMPAKQKPIPPSHLGSRQQAYIPSPTKQHSARARAAPRDGSVQATAEPSPAKDRSTVRPVQPPVFASAGFDAQVQELLARITPTAQTDKVVRNLAATVQRQLSSLVQGMEVTGFAGSELMRGTAFGVAVPEVDIVACMSLRSVSQCFRGRVQQPPQVTSEADVLKIQKKAVRLFTEHLVRDGRFKFRRSAFRGAEPKVTLLASAELGVHGEPIPFDLTFNSTSPMYNTAFLTEAGKLEPRAKALALLVKRWAKDRAMCHATKGHLSPYAWTLLTIFFLQAGLPEDGPLLPPLTDFDTYHSLSQKSGVVANSRRSSWAATAGPRLTVGELFRRFVEFYAQEVDFQKEAVSPLRGCRGAPGPQLPLNVILQGDGTTCVGPAIEDPFTATNNMAMGMNEVAFQHFRSEFQRARTLLASGASLSELLEPWSRATAEGAGEDADDGMREE